MLRGQVIEDVGEMGLLRLIAGLILAIWGGALAAQNAPSTILNGDPIEKFEDLLLAVTVGLFGEVACNATLLNEEWAITAAHCLRKSPKTLLIHEQVAIVVGFKRHPDYVSGKSDHDIALVNIRWPDRKVPLDYAPVLLGPRPSIGDMVTILGRSSNDPKTYGTLTMAEVPVTRCRHANTARSSFCTARNAKRQTTCYGDSGGAVFSNGRDGRTKLVGVISGGETRDCGEDGGAAIQISVANHMSWINWVMKRSRDRSPVQIKVDIPLVGGLTWMSFSYCLETVMEGVLTDDRGALEYNVGASEACDGRTNQMWYQNPQGMLVSYDGAENDPFEGRVYMYATRRRTGPNGMGFEVRASQGYQQTPAYGWYADGEGRIRSEIQDEMCLSINPDARYRSGRGIFLSNCATDQIVETWDTPQ